MTLAGRLTVLQHGGRILLDANLLLLLTIGSYNPALIASFKRTQAFTNADYDLLAVILASFKTLVTTPHILTEVSNLANALPSHIKTDWAHHFASTIELLFEVSESSRIVSQHQLFPDFGLTDASIARLTEDTLILTQDGRLAARLNATIFCAFNLRDLVAIRDTYR